jgi:hypothetical protein
MAPRLTTLKRLVNLYDVVEQMHSAELQRMMLTVREVEQSIEVQRSAVNLAGLEGRGALMTGDHIGRLAAETQREVAGWMCERLEKIRLEREALREAAKEQYAASRLKSEQMKRVVEGLTGQAKIEEDRRMQAATDDRYLSRRRWTDAEARADR